MRVALFLVAMAACDQAQPPSPPAKPTLEIRMAPGELADVAGLVRTELASASRDGRQLLVYVGAAWCEPCTRFHDAAQAGTLDDALGHVRLLEVDFDKHVDALQRAGYKSELIPLFAVPNPDGTASGRQIEGSIKGDGAVAEITPRLKALLVQ
jgi:thioredoxin-like negative regulator of GroEL